VLHRSWHAAEVTWSVREWYISGMGLRLPVPVWGVISLWALASALGCGDDGAPPAGDAGPDGARPDAPPAGEGALTFRATWGMQARSQIDAEWRADVPGWEPDATLVAMLCETGDPTCERPVLYREIAVGESDGEALGTMTGPTVTLEDLPEGDFLLMVMADSTRSRELGYAWDDDFTTTETAWGGVAGEGDLLLSAADDPAADGHNPAPAPVEITLARGDLTDAGTLVLAHYHERDVSPSMTAETATLVVAVDDGIRLVDLATHTLLEAGGPGEPTVRMVDTAGDPVAGTVCGLVPAGGSEVFVLYQSSLGGGFAIRYDVATRAQPDGGYRVTFAGAAGETPCRGLYHVAGTRPMLFVTNAPASPDAPPGAGVWYVQLAALDTRDVPATRIDGTFDSLLGVGVSGFAADGSTLYASVSAEAGDARVPPDARGRHAVFAGDIEADGRPVFQSGAGTYRVLQGPVRGAPVTNAAGTVACTSDLGTSALAATDYHDGRRLLFVGGCLEIAVFNVGVEPPVQLDYDAAAGEQNLDASLYGQGFAHLVVSSDGETLWAIPQRPSPFPFFVGPTDTDMPVALPRQAAFPIDLSRGDPPALRTGFETDVDGYEGNPGAGLDTPAADPGLDLGFVAHQRYLVDWAPALAGETFAPALDLAGIVAAATENSVFVAAPSGLGKASALATHDLATRRGHLWSHEGAPFYGIWTGGPDREPAFGYDVAPDFAAPVTVHGVAVVP